MATEQAVQWAEPGGRDSMASIAESRLQAAATAIERADIGITARQIANDARGWTARAARTTSTIARATLRRVRALALRPEDAESAPAQGLRAELTLGLPWLVAGGASWLVFSSTQSWTQAAIAGTCLFALSTLSAMHSAQRLEALALREQLTELRLSLRVTQALLDVESIEDAEHLEDELDDARESGTRRLTRQRVSRPQVG